MIKPGELAYYFHSDHLGTPQILTNENQTVAWKAVYTPFGEAVTSIETVENPFRFPGQYYDPETGLHYNYFRYYNPQTGRYMTPDPIGLEGGINLFAYVANGPLNRIDPLGLVHYEVDSQGFHVRLDTKNGTTFLVKFDENGSYQISQKPGHPLSNEEITMAQEKFGELMRNPAEQAKMRAAVANAYNKFKDTSAIRRMGKNMRKACSNVNRLSRGAGVGLSIGSYLLMALFAYDAALEAEETGEDVWKIMNLRLLGVQKEERNGI